MNNHLVGKILEGPDVFQITEGSDHFYEVVYLTDITGNNRETVTKLYPNTFKELLELPNITPQTIIHRYEQRGNTRVPISSYTVQHYLGISTEQLIEYLIEGNKPVDIARGYIYNLSCEQLIVLNEEFER